MYYNGAATTEEDGMKFENDSLSEDEAEVELQELYEAKYNFR